MGIFYLIQVLLTAWLIYASRKFYEYGDYSEMNFDPEDRVKIPVIAYIILIIVNIIPIIGVIADLILFFCISKWLIFEELYYKPGKFIKFLSKRL